MAFPVIPRNFCITRALASENAEMCHASNRRNCLAACLAQKRADRFRQAFPNENSASYGNQTDVLGAASGKTSPYASDPRTTAIVDGKVVFLSCRLLRWPLIFSFSACTCSAIPRHGRPNERRSRERSRRPRKAGTPSAVTGVTIKQGRRDAVLHS
jgi:hypothetical protein